MVTTDGIAFYQVIDAARAAQGRRTSSAPSPI